MLRLQSAARFDRTADRTEMPTPHHRSDDRASFGHHEDPKELRQVLWRSPGGPSFDLD
jgi:hypothetical protein